MTHASAHVASKERGISEQFVHARRRGASIPDFPGVIPRDLDSAYVIQDAAIALWPDEIAGWKVGYIGPAWRDRYPEERLVGPIFRNAIQQGGSGNLVEFPVFQGGFAAVEAEFVIRLGEDAPPRKTLWTVDEARAIAGGMYIGIELAGSPLAVINDLGPAVVISDFGNNAGLILGPAVADWRERSPDSLTCETFIENQSVGGGTALSLAGGPLAALAFALARCARRGRPLKTGDLVSTGAVTGIHSIRAGEHARVSFGDLGEILCRAVPAKGLEPC